MSKLNCVIVKETKAQSLRKPINVRVLTYLVVDLVSKPWFLRIATVCYGRVEFASSVPHKLENNEPTR